MKIFLRITLLLTLPLLSFANAHWTLERCLQTAVGNSSRLQANRWSVSAQKAMTDAMRTEGYPNLSLNGNYGYTSEFMKWNLESPVPGISSSSIEFGDGNVYDYNLAAKVPIYGGGVVRARTHATELSYRATLFDVTADSLSFLHDVREAFYLAAGANEGYNSARRLVDRLERHRTDIDAAISAGLATEESRILSQSRLLQAQSQLILRGATARDARKRLGSVMGLVGEEIEPADSSDLISIFSVTDPVARAMDLPEYLATDMRIKQSDQMVRSARGSWLPTVGGTAAYHYGKPGVNALKNDWMDYYTLGLSASWTLWDFSARDYRIHSAHATSNMLRSREEELLRILNDRISIAESSFRSKRPALQMIEQRVDLERQRLELVEGRWKAGIATETEYLDAQDEFADVEFDLINATIALRLAENDVLLAYGR